jgi:tripartite ATP-independent transporter DctP family solute receptor
MKRTIAFFILAVLVLGGISAQKKYNWKFNVPVAESSTWTRGARKFVELVEQKTGGNITIKVFPNEQLSGGDMVKAIEMARAGAFELDIHSTIIWSNIEPKIGALSLPFAFKDYATVDRLLAGTVGEIVKKLVEGNNLHFLAFGENGYRQLTTKKTRVTSPEDMKGLKFRVPTSPVMVDTFKAMGADPTVINFAELFIALQQGTVDGQENPLGLIESSKFYEVQDYVTMWNYLYDALVFSINKKAWDSLSPEYKKIIEECAKEAMAWQIKITREEDKTLLASLQEKGLEPVILTDEQIKKFQDATKPVWNKFTGNFGVEIMDALKQ